MSEKTGFIEELKRRNVIRVGIAYLVGAWLLAQAADLVLDVMGAPDIILQSLVAILALGFIPAVLFAWAFELTPEGIKRESEVNRTESITNLTAKKLDYVTIGLLVAAIAIVAIDRMLPDAGQQGHVASSTMPAQTGTQATTVAPETLSKSIAVLPFVNMSSDPEQEYFSDGISEEILNALAQVKDLKVAGRTSSFAFKGENQDLRQVGEALGVANILEGSVRKSGNKVRITAQLIQVDDGFHLWSQSFDRELTDVFAIQDEISKAILEQLKAHLLEGEQDSIVARRADSAAYDKFLLAKQRIYERSRPALESAAELLDQVIAADPAYAPAYAQRAIAAMLLSDRNYGSVPLPEAQAQAKVFIDKALELDPQQAEALSALGLYHMNRPGENAAAIEALEQALERNPNLVNASNWLQTAYADAGRLSEALAILEGLRERDPLYRPGIANLNNIYIFQDRLEDAQAQIEEVRPFMPNDPFLLRLEARVLYAQGELAKGLQQSELALSIQPENYPNIELRGQGLDATGQLERVVELGVPSQRVFALMMLGRKEESLLEARALAASGEDVSTLIGILANFGMAEKMVEFFDQRWPSLEAFAEEQGSTGGRGASVMLDLAYGFSVTGNQERFDEAMRRARAALDQLASLGFSNSYLDFIGGVYYTMAGDPEKALELLSSAADRHYVSSMKLSSGWAALEVLEGDPKYQAIQASVIEHVNSERAKLGLEPVTI